MVANVASVFENVGSAAKGEKTMRLVEELQNKRYCFCIQKNKTWQEMEQTKVKGVITGSMGKGIDRWSQFQTVFTYREEG
jgi:hypothetical protein